MKKKVVLLFFITCIFTSLCLCGCGGQSSFTVSLNDLFYNIETPGNFNLSIRRPLENAGTWRGLFEPSTVAFR